MTEFVQRFYHVPAPVSAPVSVERKAKWQVTEQEIQDMLQEIQNRQKRENDETWYLSEQPKRDRQMRRDKQILHDLRKKLKEEQLQGAANDTEHFVRTMRDTCSEKLRKIRDVLYGDNDHISTYALKRLYFRNNALETYLYDIDLLDPRMNPAADLDCIALCKLYNDICCV